VSICPDVTDGHLVEAALEAAKHAAHDGHERGAVVGHQLERHAAQLDRLVQQLEDRQRLASRHGADAEQVAGVIVDQAGEVAAAAAGGAAEVEWPLEVDVPQLVGRRALIARTGLAGEAGAMGAGAGQDAIDLPVAQRPDLAPAELGRQASAVPVGEQADGDDQALDDRRHAAGTAAPRPVEEADQATGAVTLLPAVEAGATAAQIDASPKAARPSPAAALPAADGERCSPPAQTPSPSAAARLGWRRTESRVPPGSGCVAADDAGRTALASQPSC